MQKISKMLPVVILILLVLTIATTPALAIQGPENPGGVPGTLLSAINTISKAILYIVGTVAVLFLIIGGFQYITSAGNPDGIEKAKATILYAIIGIIVALLAYSIIRYIITSPGLGG